MRAVVFDLDDTLYPELDFVRGGFAAVADYLERRHGVDGTAAASRMWTLLHEQGRGRVFDLLLDELNLAAGPETLPTMLYLYRSHVPTLTPYPDVPAVLQELAAAEFRMGVLTDGSPSVQRRKLAALAPALGLDFDAIVIVGELPIEMAKPSPAPYRVAAELLGIAPSHITYVGNDPYKDFGGARTAGMATIRVRAPSATFPILPDSIEVEADRYADPFSTIAELLLSS